MSIAPPMGSWDLLGQDAPTPGYGGCSCSCHSHPGVKHCVPCCYPGEKDSPWLNPIPTNETVEVEVELKKLAAKTKTDPTDV